MNFNSANINPPVPTSWCTDKFSNHHPQEQLCVAETSKFYRDQMAVISLLSNKPGFKNVSDGRVALLVLTFLLHHFAPTSWNSFFAYGTWTDAKHWDDGTRWYTCAGVRQLCFDPSLCS